MGEHLRGWYTEGQTGWSLERGVLRLRDTTILVTETQYGDAEFTLEARPQQATAVFGVLVRVRGGGRAIKLEFRDGRGTLRYGERAVGLGLDWRAGESHRIDLLSRGPKLLVSVDRREAAVLEDALLAEPGRFGVYTRSGVVEFRAMHVLPLD
jgi:hypothetical protein